MTAHIPAPPPTIQPESQPSTSNPPNSKQPSEEGEKRIPPGLDGAPAIYSETGFASWYGPPYHNRRAANGEIFDMNGLTAAHRTFPLNSIVRVTNLKTGHSVIVRITDRGPFVTDRIIDLSVAAAKAVDVWRPGTAKVRLDVLSAPSAINSGGRWCVQIGSIKEEKLALQLKKELMKRYKDAQVLEFPSPVGDYWVRVRVPNDSKQQAEEVAQGTDTPEGSIFLVRLD